METPDTEVPADETFAQALEALKDAYGVKEPKIADAIGAHVSTVNNWANGKAEPRANFVRALAQAYPKFSEERLFAALGKRVPAPQTADEREETLKILDRLTEEQRRIVMIQARALADSNEQ